MLSMTIFFMLLAAMALAIVLVELTLMALAKRPDSRWRDVLGSLWMARGILAVLVPLACLATYVDAIELYDGFIDGRGGTRTGAPVLAIGAWLIVWRMARVSACPSEDSIVPPPNVTLFPRVFFAFFMLVLITASGGTLMACIAAPTGLEYSGYRAENFHKAFNAYVSGGNSMGALWVHGALTACIIFGMIRVAFTFDWRARTVRVLPFQPFQALKLLLLFMFAPAIVWTLLSMPDMLLPAERIDWHHLVTPFQEAINGTFGLCLFFLLLRESEIILQSRMRGGSATDTTEAPAAAIGA